MDSLTSTSSPKHCGPNDGYDSSAEWGTQGLNKLHSGTVTRDGLGASKRAVQLVSAAEVFVKPVSKKETLLLRTDNSVIIGPRASG